MIFTLDPDNIDDFDNLIMNKIMPMITSFFSSKLL